MATRLAEAPAAHGPQSRRRDVAVARSLAVLAIVATLAAQARTLGFWFFQDDLVPYGEIVTNGVPEYLWRLVLARDLTPNWRVIPGLLYLATYEGFGMNPVPMHLILLAFHLGSVGLLFRAVWRTTSHAAAAFVAGLVFGLHPTYAGALGQVAVVPHVAAAFFLLAALNAVIECVRSEHPAAASRWHLVAVGMYVLALLSNESVAALFPAFGVAFLLAVRAESGWGRAMLRTLPFAILGGLVVFGVSQCDCTEASDVYSREHALRTFFIYAGRLLWPVGLEPPTYIDPPHFYAAIVLLALSGVMLGAGPAVGRVGVVWMLLAIVPHIFVKTHTANRFTYLAAPGFALMAAGYVVLAARVLARAPSATPAALLAGTLAVVVPWYAWQTHLQNEPWRAATANWQYLHDELVRTYPSLPVGAHVEVIGGPFTHPLDQFFVMPALASTTWGAGRNLTTFAADDPFAMTLRSSAGTPAHPYVAEFDGARLRPLTATR
jgi:hypothetical protein